MNPIPAFATAAKDLSRNPLGIIALFLTLVYGIAALMFIFGLDGLEFRERAPLVYFVPLFPILVLGAFCWLVVFHHEKLYAPQDFESDESFLRTKHPELLQLEPIASSNSDSGPPEPAEGSPSWTTQRDATYETTRRVFIDHVVVPSSEPGQTHEVFFYLTRHKNRDLSDVELVEFFLGPSWRNQVFQGAKAGTTFGLRVHAWGSFLCIGRILFRDGQEAILYDYCDLRDRDDV